MSTLLTDLASLLVMCADSTEGELPSYLKLHVLPHLPISPGLQVRLMLRSKPTTTSQMLNCLVLRFLSCLFLPVSSNVLCGRLSELSLQ